MNYNHLIFFHMLKTGGNTIKTILDRQYKPEEVFQITRPGPQTGPIDYFISMDSDKRENIKVLRGHQSFGLHEHFRGNTFYFTLMRDPISRLISFYNHVSSNPNDYYRKLIPKDERKTFGDFVMNIDKYHNQGNNGQARAIAGRGVGNDGIYSMAVQNIENHFVLVGLTERFDESVILLKKYFNWSYPYYFRRKVSKKIATKNTVSAKEIDLAREMNEIDLKLYNYSKKRFAGVVRTNKKYLGKKLETLNRINKIYGFVFNLGSSIKKKYK